MTTYSKVRFVSQAGATAGLVLESDKIPTLGIAGISRLFPYSESVYMTRIEISPSFPTWENAFAHQFN
jgi:hypothetical protein